MKFRALAVAALLSLPLAARAEIPHQQFEHDVKAAVAASAAQDVAGLKVVWVNADAGPWMDTGLALDSGDRFTVVLNGKIWLSRTYNLSFEAPIATWMKIGERGRIFRSERDTATFSVTESGTLRLKPYPAQRWVDPSGKYLGDPAPMNPDAGGGVSVAVIRWRPGVKVDDALRRLASAVPPSAWAASELQRRSEPAQKIPEGWHYLWELGSSSMFSEQTPTSASGAPARAIDLHTRNDVAILQKDVAFDLTPTTVLAWRWRADTLPARAPENSLPTHDYMSIAVEFDNGRDLTFLWSSALPVGKSFPCPLPGWDDRETHVVARSGESDLGRWLSERKNLIEHYSSAIGGPLPHRVTRVWLIGVSLFQKGEGHSQFGDIVLEDGTRKSVVQ